MHRESVDDILARHGLAEGTGAQATGGRAARRRAAEERERAERDAGPGGAPVDDPAGPGRHTVRADPEPRSGRRRAADTGAQPPAAAPPFPTRANGSRPSPDGAGRHGSEPGNGSGNYSPNGRGPGPAGGPGPRPGATNGTTNGSPANGAPPWPGAPGRPPNGGRPDPSSSDRFRSPDPAAWSGPANGSPRPGPAWPGGPAEPTRPVPNGARPAGPAGPNGSGRHDGATRAWPVPGPPDGGVPHNGTGPRPRPGGPLGPDGQEAARNGSGARPRRHAAPEAPSALGAPPTRHGVAGDSGRSAQAPAGAGQPWIPAPNGSPLSPPHGGPPVGPSPHGPAGETTALPRRPSVADAAAATTAVPTAYRGPVDNAGAATTALPTRAPRPRTPDATTAVRPGDAPQPPADATTAVRPGDAAKPADATTAVRTGSRTTDDAPADPDATRMTRHQAEVGSRAEVVSRIDESLVRMTAAHAGLDLSRTEDVEEAPPVPRGRRIGRLAVRLVAAALTLVVLGAGGLGWGTKSYLNAGIRDAGAIDLTSSAIVDGAGQKGDQNVLVVATDRSRDPATRADTVAVAHIPASGGPVVVLSLPHNLQINRPACDTWDAAAATYSDDAKPAAADTQLVTAYDEGGPRCVTKVVQQLTGLAVTQYVGLDLGAVQGLSAALQGVDVCVPTPVVDGTLGTVAQTAGTNRLDGVRAEDFVRALKVQGDPTSEFGRIDRQQKFLAAVLDRTLDERSLLDVGEVRKLRPALHDALLLDGGNGLDGALALSASLHKLDAKGVVFAAAPTTGGTDGVGNAVLRDADAATVFSALREDRALPAEADNPLAATAGPAPSTVKVQVLNASGKPGRAEQVGGTLGTLGFGVGQVGNADQPTNDTIIKFSPDQAAGAALLASSVPTATSVPDPGTNGILQLVLGKSFDDVIRPPAAAPTADPGAPAAAADGPRANCP